MIDMKKTTRVFLAIWVLAVIADYYFQFFSSRYWLDHALPFLEKLGLI